MISVSRRLLRLVCFVQAPICFALVGCAPSTRTANTPGDAKVRLAYGKLPLGFEANFGQAGRDVKFLSRRRGHTILLEPNALVVVLQAPTEKEPGFAGDSETALSSLGAEPVIMKTHFVGGKPQRLAGLEELPGRVNYFLGTDRSKWLSNVPTFRKVEYREIYSGVDLLVYDGRDGLEYDFVVAPGGSHESIRLAFEHVDQLALDGKGNLLVRAAGEEIVHRAPLIFQQTDNVRTIVPGGYVFHSDDQVGFRVGDYDRSEPLVIDPVLAYSTFLGGASHDDGLDIAVDASGRAYIVGGTESLDFPVNGSVQGAAGIFDVFVTKLDPTGSAVEFSTYLGGSANDLAFGVTVDTAGNAYVSGFTASGDFPVTAGVFQSSLNGPTDAFVAKVSSTGSGLLYSTYLGGSGFNEAGVDIAVNSAGAVHVTGITQSTDFPTTAGAFDTTCGGDGTCTGGTATDAFVTKLTSDGTGLVFSSYLGGDGRGEGASGIAVDAAGNTYVTGHTTASNFPTVNAFQGACPVSCGAGITSGFVTKFDPTGSSLLYSTYLAGSSDDRALDIDVDDFGNAYVTGFSGSTDFPTTAGAFDQICGADNLCDGFIDAFVTKFTVDGSALVFSTYLGGSDEDVGGGIVVDDAGNTHVVGSTLSDDFPTVDPLQASFAGGRWDLFVTRLNASGSSAVFSTYFGGSGSESSGPGGRFGRIAIDDSGGAYITGVTLSSGLPVTMGAFDTTCGTDGECDDFAVDALVAKITFTIEVTIDIKPGSDPNCFNSDGHGVIPVAILGGAEFDVGHVDTGSLLFDGLAVRVRGNKGPQCAFENVNADLYTDLVCHFEDEASNWEEGTATATVTGSLFDGTGIEGSDSICIVP